MPSSACSASASARPSFPTRRSSDLREMRERLERDLLSRIPRSADDVPTSAKSVRGALPSGAVAVEFLVHRPYAPAEGPEGSRTRKGRSEEHTSELQSLRHLVCRLLLAPPPPRHAPLSLHDALPISARCGSASSATS